MNDLKFTSVFISDTHLGNQFADINTLEKFLAHLKNKTDKLYLVGDIFDAWRTTDIQKYAYLFDGFKNVSYILGNHDLQFAIQNPFHLIASKAEILAIGKRNGVVTHGHFFDSPTNRGSAIGIILDKLVYNISSCIGWNLRDLTTFMRKRIAAKLEKNVAEKATVFGKDFVILGHTHEGGVTIINDTRIFNLGSWLSIPWAFYITGEDKYAIRKIEKDNLFPKSQDLHDIW